MMPDIALRGAAVWFRANPFFEDSASALHFESDALIAIAGGRIHAIGPAQQLVAALPRDVRIEQQAKHTVMVPGFIDAHVHYAQLPIIGAGGHQLLDWLEQFTFPAERKFSDYEYAKAVAREFRAQLLRNGSTSAAVFGTVHETSVEAFFDVFAQTEMKVFAGKALMDRFAPEGLMDTARSGYDQSKRLIAKWHGKKRLGYAITPRFAVTSSPEQLEATAALWREHPGTLLQSHLSENTAEVQWVRKVFPECRDYVGVFERFDLLGRGAVYGHGIHLSARERHALAESGTAIAHCPSSNAFLGSGLFDLQSMVRHQPAIPVALASDVGAGTSLSMLKTMAAAYQTAQLRGVTLNTAQLLWLATAGASEALGWSNEAGNLTPGSYADLVVLDPSALTETATRSVSADRVEDVLGAIIHCGDDRNVAATYIAGQRVWDRSMQRFDLRD